MKQSEIVVDGVTEHLMARARCVMPGGVSSPVRSFRSVGGTPRVIQRAEGAWLIDVEGRRFIDLIGAWGPAIVGHAHPAVVEAVSRAARDGLGLGTSASGDVELAEAIVERTPGVERVRFTTSGTEAVMTALRLARAATGRELVVKFDGCYHGHADAMLVRAGSGIATLGLPDSPCVLAAVAERTLVAGFNDLEAVDTLFARHGDAIAAVIVEPVSGNMGLVPPDLGFLEGLRDRTAQHGALLIFDEVMTGFRLARGGAQERFGVTADLVTLGKIIGGGLPVGAVAGPARFLDLLAPAGPVYHAGTFAGNPVVMAGGLATLRLLDAEAYLALERSSAALERGIDRTVREHDVPGVVQRVGSMLSVFFGPQVSGPQVSGTAVRSFDDVRRCDAAAFRTFFASMLEAGVHLPPSPCESWFVSLAHDDAVISNVVEATEVAIGIIAAAHARASAHAMEVR